MTAWEDFGLEVAKWVTVIFAGAVGAGVVIAATAWLRDWREARMWEQAEQDAIAALDFGDIQRRIDHFTAHVESAFNVLGYDNATPIHDELAAAKLAAELDDDDAIARWLAS